MHSQELEFRKIAAIKPHPKNVRTHPRKQIDRLTASISEFGFTSPILLDENGVILAGHARWQAAKEFGLKVVPVIVLRGLSEARKRAYVLADNKIAELAGYDRAALATELEELSALLTADDLDLSLTGFEPAEIDSLFSDFVDPEIDPADELPVIPSVPISRKGDLWVLGDRHRLLCGDARSADYGRLMRGEQAAMVFTDPPYNVSIPKTVGRGRVKHRNFAMAAGEMSPAVFTAFLTDSLSAVAAASVDGALQFICMDWRHMREMLDAGRTIYGELKNLVVWTKTNAGQGSFYRSQHELIFVYKVGAGPHVNNVELGRHGRNRSNVWTYPGGNTFRAGRMADLAAHPTVKPVALICDAIRDCSRRGDIVLDPFMGVGSTILAAERIGRRAYGIEIALRRCRDPPLAGCRQARRYPRGHRQDLRQNRPGTTPRPEGQMNRSPKKPPSRRKRRPDAVVGRGSSARAVQLANSGGTDRDKPASEAPKRARSKFSTAQARVVTQTRVGRPPAADNPHTDTSEIGFKKPPKVHSWKKGQSGNPRGRKKGSRNKKTIIISLMEGRLGRKIPDPRKLTAQEALLWKAIQRGLNGDAKAMAFAFKRYDDATASSLDGPVVTTEDDRQVYDALRAKIRREIEDEQ